MSRKLALVASFIGLFAFLVVAQPVAASHWCAPLTVNMSPLSGYAGDTDNIGVRLTNGISDALNVNSISVVFSWSSTTWDWGTMSLAGYASATNTYSAQLPSSPSDYTVSITVNGKAVGDAVASDCSFTGTFRVQSVPAAPTVVVSADRTTGSAPLTVSLTATVTNGLAPFTYAWTFGDGATDTGASGTHTFSQPGTYSVKVVVTDSRGRSASDTVTVTVQSAIAGALGTDLGIIIVVIVIIAAAAIAAVVVLMRRRRQPPQQVVQSPPIPPQQPPR